jgi:hypothetical protein
MSDPWSDPAHSTTEPPQAIRDILDRYGFRRVGPGVWNNHDALFPPDLDEGEIEVRAEHMRLSCGHSEGAGAIFWMAVSLGAGLFATLVYVGLIWLGVVK